MTPKDTGREIAPEEKRSVVPSLPWVRRLLGAGLLVLVATAAAGELRGLDIHAVREVLQALTPAQLLFMQLIAALCVLFMSLYDWKVAQVLDIRLRATTLIRNAWIANTFNNLVGFSGLAGSGIRMLLLGHEHVDTRRAGAASALIMATVPVGLSVLCWALIFAGGPGTDRLAIPGWLAWAALGLFAAYLPIYVLVLYKGLLTGLLRGLSPQSASTLVILIGISTMDWLLGATAAWVALELSGATLPWPVFLHGFVLAGALGILSLLPGGLGVFDAALIALLSPYAENPAHIVSGVLLFRLCYYLVPLFIALYVGSDKLSPPRFWQNTPPARLWRESKLPGLLSLPLDVLASLGVRVLAYMTFGAGVVLLVSAAFPTLSDRLGILYRYVPLAAVEISHVLSVAAGVLLIALSRGISGQVRSAYHLTQALLVGGAILSFLKGLDYEEALALLSVALLLRRQRARFYRESYPLLSPRGLAWLTGLLIALGGFAWLGDWVYGEIPLGWDYLSRFAPTQEAPRFARALLIATVVSIAFIGWSFYKRPRTMPVKPDTLLLSEAESVLNRYGGGELAHLTFLGDKSLLWSPGRTAFIQYGHIRDRLIALGDPCGDPDAFDATISAFRDFADLHDLTPCFYQVSQAHMHRYHDAGFALFKLGETALVEPAAFSLAGKRGEALRHGVNRARREGMVFQLLEHPIESAMWAELHAISDAWLAQRNAAEKGFSLGNYNADYLARSPIAAVSAQGRILAFASLMPDYAKHEVLGIDLMRHHPEAPNGTMDYLFVQLIEHARAQGYRYFNLGMAPLGGVGESRYARTGEKVARLAYEYGNRFYNYKGLRGFKEKFHPQWHSTYLAYPPLTPLPPLLVDIAVLVAGGYRRIFFKPN